VYPQLRARKSLCLRQQHKAVQEQGPAAAAAVRLPPQQRHWVEISSSSRRSSNSSKTCRPRCALCLSRRQALQAAASSPGLKVGQIEALAGGTAGSLLYACNGLLGDWRLHD
jgi:hypothetical protein